jgi:GNAT superfamily N-acetyltransferase
LAAAPNPQLEILDLRHFSAAKLKPLLRDESKRWNHRLLWDYTRAADTLLEYLDSRILPGYAALTSGHIHGYAFAVFEAAKAVIGDVYALHETESLHNPTCDTLLYHLIELLQNTPGIDRVESQLLMFPLGALHGPFLSAGFRSYPRLFMTCDLTKPQTKICHLNSSPAISSSDAPENEVPSGRSLRAWVQRPAVPPPTPQHHLLQSWHPDAYEPAAALIHRSYMGHIDARLNDQYQTLHGAQRFLHNIIRFPGCGIFDSENSWLLRNPHTRAIEALLLSSRVRPNAAHITQLCVEPSLRGQGLGQQLLRHHASRIARAGVKTLSLTVTEANTPAITLYHRNNFTTLHRFEAMVWDKHNLLT